MFSLTSTCLISVAAFVLSLSGLFLVKSFVFLVVLLDSGQHASSISVAFLFLFFGCQHSFIKDQPWCICGKKTLTICSVQLQMLGSTKAHESAAVLTRSQIKVKNEGRGSHSMSR